MWQNEIFRVYEHSINEHNLLNTLQHFAKSLIKIGQKLHWKLLVDWHWTRFSPFDTCLKIRKYPNSSNISNRHIIAQKLIWPTKICWRFQKLPSYGNINIGTILHNQWSKVRVSHVTLTLQHLLAFTDDMDIIDRNTISVRDQFHFFLGERLRQWGWI